MSHYTLPCGLKQIQDDVSAGAVVKRLSDDRRAMIVDCNGDGHFTVVMAKREYVDGSKCPDMKPNNYELCELKILEDWIVLTCGERETVIE